MNLHQIQKIFEIIVELVIETAKLARVGPSLGQVALYWGQVGGREPSGSRLGPCWPKVTPNGAHVVDILDRNNALE